MAVTFPNIEPTSRSFVAPKWPTTGITSQSGVTTRRLWGSRPSQAQLTLGFANITDDNAALILAAYNDAKGATTDLSLPAIIFNGASGNLTGWLNTASNGAGMKWFFSEDPPSVESVAPGRSSINIRLVAELRLT
ncbi:MAG: hypothetical protein RLZZ163_1432 [Actinomycetota bacterium]